MLARRMLARLTVAACSVVVLSCGTLLSIEPDDPAATNPGPDGSMSPGSEAGIPEAGVADGETSTSCGALATDPNNCGACGHSCGGQMCSAGLCTPQQITTAPEQMPFGSNARIATRGPRGALTDDRPVILGSGKPGFVLGFEPEVPLPTATSKLFQGQEQPTLVALTIDKVLYARKNAARAEITDGTSSLLAADGISFVALATNPMGSRFVVATSASVDCYGPLFDHLAGVPTSSANDVAFDGDDSFLVATATGIIRCPGVADTNGNTACSPVVASSNVLSLEAVGATVFFSNANGELRSASLPSGASSTLLQDQLLKPRQVHADAKGVYVLTNLGIHARVNGTSTLIVSAQSAAISSFALSTEWIFYLVPEGLFRVHR